MTTVYLLVEDHGYDGDEVLAVYATEAEADRCCAALPDAVAALGRAEESFEAANVSPGRDAGVEERLAYNAKRLAFCAEARAQIVSLVGDQWPWPGAHGRRVVAMGLRP